MTVPTLHNARVSFRLMYSPLTAPCCGHYLHNRAGGMLELLCRPSPTYCTTWFMAIKRWIRDAPCLPLHSFNNKTFIHKSVLLFCVCTVDCKLNPERNEYLFHSVHVMYLYVTWVCETKNKNTFWLSIITLVWHIK